MKEGSELSDAKRLGVAWGGVPCSRPARRSLQPCDTLALCQPNHQQSIRTFQRIIISRFRITLDSTHHNDDNEFQLSQTHSWNKALPRYCPKGLTKQKTEIIISLPGEKLQISTHIQIHPSGSCESPNIDPFNLSHQFCPPTA